MRAGQLRNRVQIKAHSDARDEYGETNTFAHYATLWAEVRQGPNGEVGGVTTRDAGVDSIEVLCRYRDDITNKMIVVWRDREYDIEGVFDEEGRGRMMRLRCLARLD